MSYQSETELIAVNEMLRNCGVAPVDTLEGNLRNDVEQAQFALSSVLRSVAVEYQYFNVYRNVELTPDGSGRIATSGVVYDVELVNSATKVVPRGNYLYNLTDNTDDFGTEPVKADVLYYISLADMPEVVRQYVIASASLRLYQRLFAQGEMTQFLLHDMERARLMLQRYEMEAGDLNMLHHPDVLRTWNDTRRGGF